MKRFHSLSIITLSALSILSISSIAANTDENLANIAGEYKLRAEHGDMQAQSQLGYLYYVGEGVEQDYSKAVEWYQKAAVQGDKDAQYNLAVAYAFGEGTEQNFIEASIWYRRSAEQGHILSQYSLALSYLNGEGIEQDDTQAAHWFKKAAAQGYMRAQIHLGSLYHTGQGVEQNYSEAIRWYRRAADRGDATAQYNLGTLYRSGKGVEQNLQQAIRWFRMAADQDYAAAQNELNSLERTTGLMSQAYNPQMRRPTSSSEPETKYPSQAIGTHSIQHANESLDTAVESTTEEIALDRSDEKTEKKPSLMARLFGQAKDKDTPTVEPTTVAKAVQKSTEPVQTITEQANPLQPDAPSKLKSSNAVENNTSSSYQDDTALETKATSDQASHSQEAELYTEHSTEKNNGFFARLFGSKQSQKTNTEPDNENEWAKPVTQQHETEPTDDSVEKSSETTVQINTENTTDFADGIPEVHTEDYSSPYEPASPSEHSAIENNAIETSIKNDKPGFFARLFGNAEKKSDDHTSNPTVEEDINKPSEIATQSKSLEQTSALTSIAQDSKIATETVRVPEQTQEQTDDDTHSNTDTRSAIQPESKSNKRGFFSRIFASNQTTNEPLESAQEPSLAVELSEYKDSYTSQETETKEHTIPTIEEAYLALQAEDYPNALERFESLAIQGNLEAQSQTASLYYLGSGIPQNYERAFNWYRRAAEQGDMNAQYSLGNMYLLGEGVKQDNELAKKWYEKAALQGHPSATHNFEKIKQLIAATATESNISSTETNHATASSAPASDALKTASEKTTEEQSAKKKPGFLSRLLGLSVKKSSVQAHSSEKEKNSSENTDDTPEAVVALSEPTVVHNDGEQTLSSSPSMSASESVSKIQTQAVQGDLQAQFKLATLYETGTTVKQNHAQAFLWYRRAAEQGHVESQYKLGNMYLMGTGIEQSDVDAAHWYQRAAKQGHVSASQNYDSLEKLITTPEQTVSTVSSAEKQEVEQQLPNTGKQTDSEERYQQAMAYAFGDHQQQDHKKAFELFKSAAEQGHPAAQYRLALAYTYGEGTAVDSTLAIDWYMKSAKQNYTIAQRNLAAMYLQGKGVSEDKVMALAWYEIIADKGSAMDIQRRDRLQAEMDAKSLEKSQQLRAQILSEFSSYN